LLLAGYFLGRYRSHRCLRDAAAMSWIAWSVIYALGAVVTGVFNYAILIYITRPLAIMRNAILWPIMLPYLIVDWVANG
jgi:hypothetical protein